MHIKQIVYQSRRDFTAVFVCEHCGFEKKMNGYDDEFFHEKVIPKMTCDKCGKIADDSYRPLTTKYPDNMEV